MVILGAAHGTPYRPGTPSHAAGGPSALRAALGWYSARPGQFDFDLMGPVFGGGTVLDGGDLVGDLRDGGHNRRMIREAVTAIAAAGAAPLILGGDDSVPIPVLEGLAGGTRLAVLQIDAHIDWRDEVDGVRHGFSSTMRRASEMAHVRHIVQLGARGPGSARMSDLADAHAWGARVFPARDLHRDGLQPALATLPHDADVFLSIDVDGVDPSVVPGVILPAFGGLDYTQLLQIFEYCARCTRIVGAAFVEYVPERDPTGTGAIAIARLVSVLAGLIARQRRSETPP